MNGNAIPNVYTFIYLSYLRHKSHIHNKSLTENMPFFIVRKVKLLFGVTQLNKKKNLFHSITCVIPPNNQLVGVPQAYPTILQL